jgi:hypothetical protein
MVLLSWMVIAWRPWLAMTQSLVNFRMSLLRATRAKHDFFANWSLVFRNGLNVHLIITVSFWMWKIDMIQLWSTSIPIYIGILMLDMSHHYYDTTCLEPGAPLHKPRFRQHNGGTCKKSKRSWCWDCAWKGGACWADLYVIYTYIYIWVWINTY